MGPDGLHEGEWIMGMCRNGPPLLFWAAVAILSSAYSVLALGAVDSRRIPCLVMGDSVQAPYNPFTALFMQDPLFRYSLYPLPHSGDAEKRKLDRVYYPRTFDSLVDSYDVMIFRDARVSHFSPVQFRDLERAFREAGMVSVTVHSLSWNDVWIPTILYDLSPISEYDFRFSSTWTVRFRRDRYPVFLPFVDLGMEKVSGWEYGIPEAKEGATIWADILPQGCPWLVSWRPGGSGAGLQWVFADKFDVTWWGTAPGARETNPYALDLATNLLLYSLDRDLISDILARREARRLLSTFQSRKILILSVLDWAEKFGANILDLTNRLSELERKAGAAVGDYLDQDYASTIQFMESMLSEATEMTTAALQRKDQALYWVYISEWLSVTSASVLAGALVWSLMVRRRRYREAGRTRLRMSLFCACC